jgi:hypothetical protein
VTARSIGRKENSAVPFDGMLDEIAICIDHPKARIFRRGKQGAESGTGSAEEANRHYQKRLFPVVQSPRASAAPVCEFPLM